MFRKWLTKWYPHAPFQRVSDITVSDDGFQCSRINGLNEEVLWADVTRILVRTTDRGPFDDDVFFVIETGKLAYWIPQSATGVNDLFTQFEKFDDFDFEPVLEAMSCTDNHEFVCWQRESEIRNA